MEEELDRQAQPQARVRGEDQWPDPAPCPPIHATAKKKAQNPLFRLNDQMRTRSIFFNVIGIILGALLIGPFALLLWAIMGRGIVHVGTIVVIVLSLPFAGAGFLFLGNAIYNFWTYYVRK